MWPGVEEDVAAGSTATSNADRLLLLSMGTQHALVVLLSWPRPCDYDM
jgi:hypothetical protein